MGMAFILVVLNSSAWSTWFSMLPACSAPCARTVISRGGAVNLYPAAQLAEQVERLESVIYSCPPGSPASEGGSSSSCSSPCLVRVYGAASLTGSTRSRDGLRGLSGDLLIKDELSALDKSNGVWTVKQQGEDAPVYDHAKAFPYSFQPTVTQSVSASVAVDPELAAQLIGESRVRVCVSLALWWPLSPCAPIALHTRL